MKVVLAGAFGRLGSEILKRLVAQGHEVIAANSGKGIYLDDGTLVGRLLPAIDRGLGYTQKLNARLSL